MQNTDREPLFGTQFAKQSQSNFVYLCVLEMF